MSKQHSTMRAYINEAMQLARVFPVLFIFIWAMSFLTLFGILAGAGWVPSEFANAQDVKDSASNEEAVVEGPVLPTDTTTSVANAAEVKPVRIIIDAIDVDIAVLNPESQDIALLDEALLDGAVRYPGSADLEEEGNMFLFGHSSYLPKVINPSFKAFNGLQHLEKGDIVRVRSEEKEYIYRVTTVELVDANDVWVDFSGSDRMLTLSTCNTFGQKQDRFVVEAEFIGSYDL